MSNQYPYARFQNLLVASRKEAADAEFEGCDEILSFIAEASDAGKVVRITELVQYIAFGTGPTVHRKCNLLAARGFLNVEVSDADKRAKTLTLTKKAHRFLADRSNLMHQIIKKIDPII